MNVDVGSGLFWGWGWLAGVGVIILLGIFLLPWFFFLLNLQNLLEHVSPANRRMTPGLVWLNFIPIFHLGWFIYTVIKVKDSVSAEFQSRGWMIDGDLGYNVGLTAGILWIAAFFIGWIPFIGWVLPLAGVVCWIIYWLKTSDLKHRLERPAALGTSGRLPRHLSVHLSARGSSLRRRLSPALRAPGSHRGRPWPRRRSGADRAVRGRAHGRRPRRRDAEPVGPSSTRGTGSAGVAACRCPSGRGDAADRAATARRAARPWSSGSSFRNRRSLRSRAMSQVIS